jgi:TonB family protein
MRPFSVVAFAFAALASISFQAGIATAQSSDSQTARQALIEMFFGQAPGHLEKHLPDVTRKAFEGLSGGESQSYLKAFASLAAQARNGKEQLETYDTGTTLVAVTTPTGSSYDKVELTVEADSLSGDEDQIELAIHVSRAGKEEALPFIPRFTFTMKMEAEVWRLNEISVSLRFPLADPAFLNSLLERQRSQNEQMTIYSMRSVVTAQTSYQSANSAYACTLSALGNTGKQPAGRHSYLYDTQLVSGKKNGYVFAISACDSTHYQLVAEPAAGSGQRAFCADESGDLRASSDGKGVTCLSSGEIVAKTPAVGISEATPPQSATPSGVQSGTSQFGTTQPAQRVRVSQGVSTGLLVSKVSPVYPPDARAARIQGTVIMKALINKAGDVESLELVSGHPMLAPAAMDAVKQWKYKPYLLNGKAVEVETQITVNYTLSGG